MGRRVVAAIGISLAAIMVSGIILFGGGDPSPNPQLRNNPEDTLSRPRQVTAGFVLAHPPRRFPDFSFQGPGGQTITLERFRNKTVLLNLWATWCVPCRAEIPSLDRLQSQLGNEEFEVVALSIDRGGLEAVQPFYVDTGVKRLGIYLDPTSRSAAALNAPGLPTTLLVDREGREVGRLVGPAEWDSEEWVARIRQFMSSGKLSG